MKKRPVPHRKIVFVCTNCREDTARASCGNRCGGELRDRLKAMVKERRLKSRIRVSQSGCLDRCEEGPNIMVFPDNVWYSGVELADLEGILDEIAGSLEAEAQPEGVGEKPTNGLP